MSFYVSHTLKDLPDPRVIISPEDFTVTAGRSLTVKCTVDNLAVKPTVNLTGPKHNELASDMNFEVTYTLDEAMTSDAGVYTCRASVVIDSVGVNVSGQNSSTLVVQTVSK